MTYVPLSRNDDTVVTQYTMTTIEELGLLKMDFLGLRNLTVIRRRREAPSASRSRTFRSANVCRTATRQTFAMLAEGKTAGRFPDGIRRA